MLLPCVAFAQAGAGAERYEVTITPPKRPGTETPAASPGLPQAAVPSAGAAAGDPASAAADDANALPGTPGAAVEPGIADSPGAAASPASTGVAAGGLLEPVPAPAAAGPVRTLQVGAFRQRSSADSLHDALAASFHDVVVTEVQSGGEPLYRVHVGRMPRGAALEDLKRRLAAAGHPAFEVIAPPSLAE